MLFSPFSIAITSFGEGKAGLCAFHAFVCFRYDSLCFFPLPLGVRDWLRFVIAGLPGRFVLHYRLLIMECNLDNCQKV